MERREKRKHFRIDDRIDFNYVVLDDDQPVNKEQLIQRLFDKNSLRHYRLIEQFTQLDAQTIDINHRVSHQNPDASALLKQLDRKLELMAQAIFMSDETTLTPVNISLGGMAFPGHTFIAVGKTVKVRITTLPCYKHVIADAKVIYCKAKSNQSFKVIIKFEPLTQEQENLLNQHIMYVQGQQAAFRVAEQQTGSNNSQTQR